MKKIIYIIFLFISVSIMAQEKNEVKKILYFSVRGLTPIGIFSEDWKTGGAGYVGFSWIYSYKWSVRIQTGYNRYGLKKDTHLSSNSKLQMIPFQIGGRRYFNLGKVKPFAEAMTGVNVIKMFYEEYDLQVDKIEFHMNFQLGCGLALFLPDNFQFEFAVLYNSHLINPSIPYNLTGFEYGFAVNWGIK
jgi:hypothetical protein